MNTSESLPTINAVWIGNTLGPIHSACLRSFVKQGHRVVLHCFEAISDLPAGVETFDANRLMKRAEIVKHGRTGSLALASDIYRLRILAEGMGVYVDCDVFALCPIEDQEYIFGWDSCHAWSVEDMHRDKSIHGLINGAVLRMPSDSDLMRKMLSAAEDPYFIPPWLSVTRARRWRWRKALGFPVPVTKQEWGVIGPIALTHYVRELGLTQHVAAPDTYYFFRGENHRSLLSAPNMSLRDILTPRAKAIHLCSSGGLPSIIVPGSPLDEMLSA